MSWVNRAAEWPLKPGTTGNRGCTKLTAANVKPIAVGGCELLVDPGLHEVNPLRHLELHSAQAPFRKGNVAQTLAVPPHLAVLLQERRVLPNEEVRRNVLHRGLHDFRHLGPRVAEFDTKRQPHSRKQLISRFIFKSHVSTPRERPHCWADAINGAR